MPSNYQSKSIEAAKRHLTEIEQAERDHLATLIRDYEAVRCERGPLRDMAERALGAALARRGEPFRLGDRVWQWSRTQGSILRHKVVSPHQVSKYSR